MSSKENIIWVVVTISVFTSVSVFGNSNIFGESLYDSLSKNKDLKKSYTQGDLIKIESCDKWKWCKVEGHNAYVKGYYFKKLEKNTYVKQSDKITFLYMKNKDLIADQKFSLTNFLKDTFLAFTGLESKYIKINSQFGYTRIIEEKDRIPKRKEATQEINQKTNDILKVEDQNKTLPDKTNMEKEKTPTVEKKVTLQNNNKVEQENTIEPKIDDVVESKEIVIEEDKYLPWFVFGGFAYSMIDFTNNTNVSLTNESKDDTGVGLELGIGKYMTENLSLYFSIQQEEFAAMKLNQYLLGANYDIGSKDKGFIPFVGGAVGYSKLKWSQRPIASVTSENDYESNEFAFGANLGLKYKFDSQWKTYVKYQYLVTKHTTYINNDTLVNENLQNIFFGIQHNFGKNK